MELAIDLGLKAEYADKRLELELQRERSTCEVKVDYQETLRDIEAQAYEEKEANLVQALEDVQPRWYETPPVVAAVTFAATILAVWGATEIVSAR